MKTPQSFADRIRSSGVLTPEVRGCASPGPGCGREEWALTEAEWLSGTDPLRMLEFLWGRASNRQLGLFACACCRHVWRLLADERSQLGVWTAERCLEGEASPQELKAAHQQALEATRRTCWDHLTEAQVQAAFAGLYALEGVAGWLTGESARAAVVVVARAAAVATRLAASEQDGEAAQLQEQRGQCALLRDLCGNPFCCAPVIDPAALAWEGRTVVNLARCAYGERILPGGHLDSACLAVLTDALEEAGCTDSAILGHLRGPGPHTRGCWLLDLLLAKE